MANLGDVVNMEYSQFKILRQRQPIPQLYEFIPCYGVNTKDKVVTYYNTEGLPNQAEIEADFAYSIWTEYKHY